MSIPSRRAIISGIVELEGIWEAQVYRLYGGTEHAVRGRIFFLQQEWTVLFFVLDGRGKPVRASAEGGSYQVDGGQLTFTHHYHFSGGRELDGLPTSPLKMEVQDTDRPSEPCTFQIEGPQLTVFFPSGNSMVFQRTVG